MSEVVAYIQRLLQERTRNKERIRQIEKELLEITKTHPVSVTLD